MNMHLTDEELIQHFYGDGRLEDEPDVDAHLRTCAVCAAAWHELTEALKLVDASAVPEPDAGFERVMWARVRQALPLQETRPRVSFRFLLPAAGLAAVIVLAIFVAGRFSPGARPAKSAEPTPAVTSTTA